jgi:hypothetical protein
MSYARFGWDDSDVYVYLDCGGYLTCCACKRLDETFPQFHLTAAMLNHLEGHRARGDVVPEQTFEELRQDAAENDAWMKTSAWSTSWASPSAE